MPRHTPAYAVAMLMALTSPFVSAAQAQLPPSQYDKLQRTLEDKFGPKTKPAPVAAKLAPAPQPQPTPTLTIDDLRRVDGRALAEAVGSLDSRTALLALAAAPDEVVDNLTAGLPRTAAHELRQRMHRVGPTTLAEIDRAQTALALSVEKVIRNRRTQRSASMGRA